MSAITADPIPELEALGNLVHLHARIAGGIVWLRAHNRNDDEFEAGRRRLDTIADEYLSALVAFTRSVPDDELLAQLTAVEAKLNAGWGKHSSPAGDDRWVQLLTVHEILVDVQLQSTYLARLNERIDGCRKADATIGVRSVAQAGVAK